MAKAHLVSTERFSTDRRQTNTKVIALANHNRQKVQRTNQNSKQKLVTGAKRGKNRATKSALVLLLIGRESDANFANQSQRILKYNQSKRTCDLLVLFDLHFYWFRNWRNFFFAIDCVVKQNQSKREIIGDTIAIALTKTNK